MFSKTVFRKILFILLLIVLSSSMLIFMSFRLPAGDGAESQGISGNLPGNDLFGPIPGKDTSNGSSTESDDSNSTGTATGFVTSEIIYLKADGTGDYATLEEAIAGASAGAMIMLAKGTYEITDYIEIKKSIAIMGAGADKTIVTKKTGDESLIYFGGNGKFILDSITFKYEGEENCDVIKIDSGELFASKCVFMGGYDADPEDEEGWGIGIYFYEKAKGTVTDCTFDNNDFAGIEIADTASVNIMNSIVKNNFIGINYYCDTGGGTAINNEVFKNSENGIEIQLGSSPMLVKNYSHDNTLSGIIYFDNSGGFAISNRVENNKSNGIEVGDDSGPTIMYNTIKGNKANNSAGLVFWENATGTAIGNTITNNSWGIYIGENSDPYIGENSVSGNATNFNY
jgi:parallel beta-helix repeat protein